MPPRFMFNEKTKDMIDKYKPILKHIKRIKGENPFPIFATLQLVYEYCVYNDVQLFKDNIELNYFKNGTQVFKKIANDPNNGVLEYVGKIGKNGRANFYKIISDI